MPKPPDRSSRSRPKPARASVSTLRRPPRATSDQIPAPTRSAQSSPVAHIAQAAIPSATDATRANLSTWAPSWQAQQQGLKLLQSWTRYQLSVAGDCLSWTQAQARLLSARTPAQLAAAQSALVQDIDDSHRRLAHDWLALAAQTQDALQEFWGDSAARLGRSVHPAAVKPG